MGEDRLSYEEFVSYIKENIEDRLEQMEMEEVSVSVKEVMKNNGMAYDTLVIGKMEQNCRPLFYLRELYDRYLNEADINQLIDEMVTIFEEEEPPFSIQEEWLADFSQVHEQIIMKLVNFEKNEEQLKDCPYIRELDLALTFRIVLDEQPEQIGTILINNDMLEQWDLTEFELFEIAAANMNKFWKPTLEPIEDVIQNFLSSEDKKELELEAVPMYVLSNNLRFYGASTLFYTDSLSNFAEKLQRDIYVLPSSVHEVLLVPKQEDVSAGELHQIVEEANEEVVSAEEFLSNHVYCYLYKKEKLIIEV